MAGTLRSRLILRFAVQPYSEMTLLDLFLTCFGFQLGPVRNINVVRAFKPAS